MRKSAALLTGIVIALLVASIGLASSDMIKVCDLGLSIGDINLTYGQKLVVRLNADPGSVITYSTLPKGAVFDQASFTLTWVAGEDQTGPFSIEFSGFINGLAAKSVISGEVLNCRVQIVTTGLNYIWSPNNKLVNFEIILLDADGNRADIEILDIDVVDTLRKDPAEAPIPEGKGKGLLKEDKVPQSLLNGKKDGEFSEEDGEFFLMASRLGLIAERTYVITFRGTYPMTGLTEEGIISISIPHDMSGMNPDEGEEDEPEEEKPEEEESEGRPEEAQGKGPQKER